MSPGPRAAGARGSGRGWIGLGLLVAAALVVTAVALRDRADGRAADQEGPQDGGKWRRLRTPRLTADQRAEIEALEAIGYVETSQRAAAPHPTVPVWDRDRAWNGRNFATSGHAAEAVLVEMDGTVVHRWHADFWSIWPDSPAERTDGGTHHFRRAVPLEDGGVLAIYEGKGIVRLDRDSTVVWAQPNRAHHDAQVQPDGSVWVLTREAGLVPEVDPDRPILEDFVVQLGPDGQERRRVSLLRAFAASPAFAGIFAPGDPLVSQDVFHANSLEILDGRWAGVVPAFQAGRALVSLLTLDAVAVVDLDAGTVVWAQRGPFRRQHDPGLVPPAGNLLLFDNLGAGKRARILEFEPATMALAWSYEGTEAAPFRSDTLGTAQRLPNGNTLVTESDGGRAFEITREGEIVWEYVNPHRAGEDDAWIAALFEVIRLPPQFGDAWLTAP